MLGVLSKELLNAQEQTVQICRKISCWGKKTGLVKQRSQASTQGVKRIYHVYKGGSGSLGEL